MINTNTFNQNQMQHSKHVHNLFTFFLCFFKLF